MNKRISLIISLILSLVVFVAGFAVFAQEISIKGDGSVTQTEFTAENTSVTLKKDKYVYTGKAVIPSVAVAFTENGETKTLTINSDYIVSYRNNIKPGKATVTVSGANSYKGNISRNFIILPAKVKGVSTSDKKLESVKVSWEKQEAVSGYEVKIARANKNKYKTFTVSPKKSSYTVKGLKYSTDYKVRVCSFVRLDGKRVYGALSQLVKTSTVKAVASPKVSGYCSLTSRPTVEWKKVKKASGYIVFRAAKKNGEYKKIGKTNSLSFTDKSAKMHKTYFYKVVAVRKIKDKKYKSSPSEPVKIKAMKTVLVGDSVLEGVQYYKTLPDATYVVKIGMGTYTFYESFYFTVNGKPATGCEKLLSYKPDRVFIMFGMNETAYKGNSGILDYYQYALDDIKAARPKCEIVLLPVSPTKANSGKSIPKKKRINSFNSALKDFADKNKVGYYDYTAPFKDKNGNLLDAYDGGDGCHWKPSSCRLFIDQMNKYVKTH